MIEEKKSYPKISIISATHNAAGNLEKAIQSVISQEYPNLEYIVIDGASTDGTIDSIKKYDRHITRWISEKDTGLYEAINKGIKLASGEIIGILNSDDYYLKDSLKEIAEKAKKNPEADVFYGDIIYEIPGRPSRIIRSKKDFKQTDFYRMPIKHPTVFVKKDCYKKFGAFNLKYKIGADADLMLKFLEKGARFHYIKRPITCMKSGGMSYLNPEVVKEVKNIIIKRNIPFPSLFRLGLDSFKLKCHLEIIKRSKKWKIAKTLLNTYYFLTDLFSEKPSKIT